MTAKELQAKSVTELHSELARLTRELNEGRLKIRMNQLKNVRSLRPIRQDIARVLTVLGSKGIV